MSFATREDFINRPEPFTDVPVPELGEGKTIRVAALSARDKVRYLGGFWRTTDGSPTFDASGCRARMLTLVCRAADGSLLFTAADAPLIEAFDAQVVERLADAADALSGTESTAEELRELFRRARTSASL